MTAEQITIIGATATVIAGFGGAFLGAIISYRYSIKLMQRQELNKAVTDLRANFLEPLLYLKEDIEPNGFTDIVSYLHKLYPAHAAAIIKFTPYLDEPSVKRMNRAWSEYKFPDGVTMKEAKEGKQCFPIDDYGHMPEERAKRTALEKIENLLAVCGHNINPP